jgi:uncharacterized protein
MSESLRERLDALYRAMKSGRLNFVLNAFDDNIEYISYAPEKVFPYLGHHRGKEDVAASLRMIHEEFEFLTYEPIFMVVEVENAAVIVFARVYQRATRRTIQLVIAHFLRFRGGRIVELREFMDSFDAVQQLLGRELKVPAQSGSSMTIGN